MKLEGARKTYTYNIHNNTRVAVIRALRELPPQTSWEDDWPRPYQLAFEAIIAIADDLYMLR